MMAHNLSAHALSSALGHLSSPYAGPDHSAPSRHIPALSVPEILDAFHQSHPSSNTGNLCNNSQPRSMASDAWELPELKWLDPADNAVPPGSNLPEPSCKYSDSSLGPDRYPLDGEETGGERWPFSALYAGDRVAANSGSSAVADSLAHFSLQSMVTPSPGTSTSGSSVLPSNNRGIMSSMNKLSNFSGRDFPISANSQAPEWRSNGSTATGSSIGSHRRPDSDLSQETPNSDRASFRLGAGAAADKFNFPERLVSGSEVSALTANCASPSSSLGKRSRQQQQQVCATPGREGNNASPSGSAGMSFNQKLSAERGCLQTSTMSDQDGSPGRDSKKSAAAAGSVSDHEIHIWTERERRKKMNGMFSTLHALLPRLTSKADKSTIVDEAINYIQTLEGTMKGLLKRKSDSSSSSMAPSSLGNMQAQSPNGSCMASADAEYSPPSLGFCGEAKPTPTQSGSSSPTSTGESYFQTRSSPNVVLNVCGVDSFVTICSPRGRSGLLCRILFVLESHGLNVRNAHISTTDETILYMLHAQTIDNTDLKNPDMLNIALQELTSSVTPPL